MTIETVEIARLAISTCTLIEATSAILSNPREEKSSHHLVNAYSISLAARNSEYMSTLQCGVCFPDGKPLSIFAGIKSSRAFQIRGPSLFEKVLSDSSHTSTRHFFLGGSDELLQKLTAKIELYFPNTEIAGSFSPPFRDMTNAELIEQDSLIRKSNPDIVWVGLGTPRQDIEALRICRELGLTTVAIGAAFDFFSGMKRESPRWLAFFGLEWAFRLASEPRRLWKRYLVGNLVFLWAVLWNWRK